MRLAIGLTWIALAATAGCAAPGVSGAKTSQPASSLSAAERSSPPAIDEQVERRLWSVADSAAKSDAGVVKAARAVRSTRAAAVMLMDQSVIADEQPVWLVQVEGIADFVCDACSRPSGAAAPRGRFLTVIVGATTFEGLDGGLDSTKVDLRRLGTVLNLHTANASPTPVGSVMSPGA